MQPGKRDLLFPGGERRSSVPRRVGDDLQARRHPPRPKAPECHGRPAQFGHRRPGVGRRSRRHSAAPAQHLPAAVTCRGSRYALPNRTGKLAPPHRWIKAELLSLAPISVVDMLLELSLRRPRMTWPFTWWRQLNATDPDTRESVLIRTTLLADELERAAILDERGYNLDLLRNAERIGDLVDRLLTIASGPQPSARAAIRVLGRLVLTARWRGIWCSSTSAAIRWVIVRIGRSPKCCASPGRHANAPWRSPPGCWNCRRNGWPTPAHDTTEDAGTSRAFPARPWDCCRRHSASPSSTPEPSTRHSDIGRRSWPSRTSTTPESSCRLGCGRRINLARRRLSCDTARLYRRQAAGADTRPRLHRRQHG